MSNTNTIDAHDVLREIAGLLIKYRDQDQVGDQAPGEESEVAAAEPATASAIAMPAPWEAYVDHDPNWKKAASLEMSPTLYAKIQWVTHNVPKMSQRKLIMAGAEAEADRLIALYYKPN